MTAASTAPVTRSRRWLLAAGAGAVTVLAAGTASARLGGDRGPAAPPAPGRTVKVRRTTLVEGQTFKAGVDHGDPVPMASRLPGTVTRLPAVGQVLKAGDAAFWLDGLPVIVMTGTTPAYRPLTVDVKGADVRQLEQHLQRLGLGGIRVDDTFSASTATAVRRWQQRNGLPQTGVVELGRVVFLPEEARVAALKIRVGEQAGAGPLYETTGTRRRVVVSMETKHRRLAPPGAAATILLADGASTAGVVREIIENTGEEGDKLRVVVDVADQAALAAGGATSVQVRLVVRERKDVLAVPVVALLALDGDRYGVQVVTGTTTRTVPVDIGLFAAGQVEISGDGIAEGTDVSVPAP